MPSSTQENTYLVATDLRLLRTILLLTLGLGVPLSIVNVLIGHIPFGPQWFLVVGLLALSCSTAWLFHRKRMDATLTVFLWGFAFLVTGQSLIVNGIRSPITAAFPIVVILSAWSRSVRQTTWLFVVIILALSAMALLDAQLWPQLKPRAPIQYWTTYVFCMFIGAILAQRLASAMRAHQEQQLHTSRELAIRVSELQLAQEKFSTFFYLNPVPVSISLLADGTYYDVNPAWENLSGWHLNEVRGRTSTDVGLWLTQADRDKWIGAFRQSGRTRNELARFRLRDGSVRYFVSSCETVNYDGRPCIFAAFVDVTERREAEEALMQLNTQLEERVAERTRLLAEANQALANTVDTLQRTQDELVHSKTMASLGAMVAGVSHELNTPIGNALTVTSSLQEQAREMAENFDGAQITRASLQQFITNQQHGAELAATSLHRASELVASFKQVAVDQTSERRRVFDLADIIAGVLNALHPSVRFKPVALQQTLAPDLQLDSYPGPLGQVVTNLVQNALLHGLDDRPAGIIHVSTCSLDADNVQITVCDDGHGISDAHMSRIFDPFFTTRLGQGGSGLGLSIVYRLVTTLLGGTITVSSQPGKGACFTITLPRVAPAGPIGPT